MTVGTQGVRETPIDHHLFLSDLRTAAILDARGSVVWMCIPRMDGPPLFGSLVGGPELGSFSILPAENPEAVDIRQEYELGTIISKTSFQSVVVTDFLDCSGGRAFQRAGRTDLVRIVEGSDPVRVRFAPKLDFGRISTRILPLDGGLRVHCGQYLVSVKSPGIEWKIERKGLHDEAEAVFVPGDSTVIELSVGTGTIANNGKTLNASVRLRRTESFWRAWANTLSVPPVKPELVSRSALVLRGLCYGPSGAIAAAATTSLPECIGGVRNWDYRFCWPRDAAFAANALLRLGTTGPGMRLLDWLLALFEECGEEDFLRPVYTLSGRHLQGEAEIGEASGYRGSIPVRVGNLAAQQLQLDSLGPIAQLLGGLARSGAALSPEHCELGERMVGLVRHRWRDPDHGIWEVRTEQRQFVHSKLMCWFTVSECLSVAEYLGLEKPEWRALRDEIRADIEQNGFDRTLGSYTAAYGRPDADASLLWIILTEFHAPNDPRSTGTVKFVMDKLLRDHALFRYHYDDALAGDEGAFHICTGWLIEALVMMGRQEEARGLFDRFCERVGPTGLLAEQWDSKEGVALGNFPQAYSHLALINAACALSSEVFCPLTSV